MFLLFSILFSTFIYSEANFCPVDNFASNRSIYSIGETISNEDQSIVFPVCNGSGDYESGSSFSFSDLNGDLNGGDYKVTIISMNATW